MTEKTPPTVSFGSVALFVIVVAAIVIGIDRLHKHWQHLHNDTSHLIGTIYDINHEANSFVFAEFHGYSGFEQFHVDGDMPLASGRCIDIEYTPKIEFGLFWSSDDHQIRIVHATPSEEARC